MQQNNDFLALYREYESLLREQGMEYKQVEDSWKGSGRTGCASAGRCGTIWCIRKTLVS